jgi:hypothetical protein
MTDRRKISTLFDSHDHEQLILLARLNHLKPTDMIRKIVQAYLDNRELPLERPR